MFLVQKHCFKPSLVYFWNGKWKWVPLEGGKWQVANVLIFSVFFVWTFPYSETHAHCTLIQNIWVELTANPLLSNYPNYPKYLNWPKSPPCMLIGRAVSCRNSCKIGRQTGLLTKRLKSVWTAPMIASSVVRGWNCNFVSCREELFREYQRLQEFTAENVRWTKFRIKPFKGGVR